MKKILFIFITFLASLQAYSQEAFNADDLLKPGAAPKALVTDYSKTLTEDQRQALESKLVAYDDSTSTQIAVVLVPDLSGNDVSDFAFKLGRAWGIGGSKFNNGVLFLISVGEHKMEIATGYGAEGALPDVTAKHILDDVVRPQFKGGDYYRGIDEGTTAIMQALKGEYTAPENYGASKRHIPWGTIIFIIIMIIMALVRGGVRGGGGGLASTLFWGSMLGGGGRGGWSNSDFGGGGSGGGGFGGFGGGSFGGGGASGSW